MTKICQECKNSCDEHDFEWTHDRYGIPWRKVCRNCAPKVNAEIQERFRFDPDDAGESLE